MDHPADRPAPLRRRTAAWALYWPRHTGRWHRYEEVRATSDVASLLAEIDADPDGVFWG
jgi:hypothetical protein